MTIFQIKKRTRDTSPYFFSPGTLRFFGQRMSSFTVQDLGGGKYRISAPIYNSRDVMMGETVRIFNEATNELENE